MDDFKVEFSCGRWQRGKRGDYFSILARGIWFETAEFNRTPTIDRNAPVALQSAIVSHFAGRKTALMQTGQCRYTLPAVI